LSGGDFEVRFDTADPPGTVEAECSGGAGEVDLTHGLILDYLRRAVLDGGRVNPVSALQEAAAEEA
jgi:hypothetical protein